MARRLLCPALISHKYLKLLIKVIFIMSIQIHLLENIHFGAKKALLNSEIGQVIEYSSALSSQQLSELDNVDIIGIRSKTNIDETFINSQKQLLAIGCFCIGTDQVDLDKAKLSGAPVFNAPYSNTRSVAELVIGEVICLSRRIKDFNEATHLGNWQKTAKGSHEVRGRTIGIIGYGHIGSQVGVLAESLGLRVIYFDTEKKLPLGNAESVDSLNALLSQSDFVTLHVPDTEETRDLININKIKLMKKGSYLLNLSRGKVVNISDLSQALRENILSGAALDVYPEEPKSLGNGFKSELQNLPNVILTPHIGGSTEEAQQNIGLEVSSSLINFIKTGTTLGSVNFPKLNVPVKKEGRVRLVNIHKNIPGAMGKINAFISNLNGNIVSQYLSTDSSIGYVVTDIEGIKDQFLLKKQVSNIDENIKTRLI